MALTEHYVTTGGTDTYANSTNPATPCSLTTALGAAVAGDRVKVKVGTYARTTTSDTVTNSGTATSPIIFSGYSSTITDGYLGRTNGNGPLITTNMPLITYTTGRLIFTGTFVLFEAINFSGATTGLETVRMSADSAAYACNFTNTGTAGSAVGCCVGMAARSILLNCDAQMTGSGQNVAVLVGSATNPRIIGCRVTGGSHPGITISSGSPIVAFNTIFASTGNGLSTISGTGVITTFLCNTIVGGGADGIKFLTGLTTLQCIIGNMITDNVGGGIDMTSTSNAAVTANIRTRDNAADYQNNGDWITATNYAPITTDTGGPETDYVSAGSPNFDYRLIAASPAVDKGIPLYADIGALQRIEVAAGGGLRLAGHGGLAS